MKAVLYSVRVVLGLAAAVLVVSTGLVPAEIVLGIHDWDVADTLEGWSEDEDFVSLSNPNSGGVDDSGYLRIRFGAGRGEGARCGRGAPHELAP